MNYIFLIRGSQKTRNLMRLQIMGSLLVVKIFESLNNRENANGSYVIWGGGEFAPQAVFCCSSKRVGARLLKLCNF